MARKKAKIAILLILAISFAFGRLDLAALGFLESPATLVDFVDSLISASESDAAVEARVDGLVLEDMFVLGFWGIVFRVMNGGDRYDV